MKQLVIFQIQTAGYSYKLSYAINTCITISI